MNRNLLSAIALLAFGLLLAGWRFLLAGVSQDFGLGVAVGGLVVAGLLGVIFKSVRDLA